MKISVPNQNHLIEDYSRLQSDLKKEIQPAELIRPGLNSHFDPRMMEIWVQFVGKNWQKLNPVPFNQEILKSPDPATFGLLLNQCELFVGPAKKKLYKAWTATALAGVGPNQPVRLYFIGLNSFAGKEMQKDRDLALSLFLKWGYLGREIAVHNTQKAIPAVLKKADRLTILKQLVAQKKRFGVGDYLERLEFECRLKITGRQAQRDLSSVSNLKKSGRTKDASYAKVTKAKKK